VTRRARCCAPSLYSDGASGVRMPGSQEVWALAWARQWRHLGALGLTLPTLARKPYCQSHCGVGSPTVATPSFSGLGFGRRGLIVEALVKDLPMLVEYHVIRFPVGRMRPASAIGPLGAP
jgi:hypothetical protein